MTRRATPEVGVPYVMGEETLICTYVRESEAPLRNGMCITHDKSEDVAARIAGWYVEFHYPHSTESYRRFISFTEE